MKEYNVEINNTKLRLVQESNYVWRMPKTDIMRVDGVVYASQNIIENMVKDRTLWQLRNVSSLPGIVKHAILMPDGHEGYGFPIGGVAGFDIEEGGIISPGGVGFDINCGVRLLRTNLKWNEEFQKKRNALVDEIFKNVPAGLGEEAKIKFSKDEVLEILEKGVDYAILSGFGWREDKEFIEESGRMKEVSTSYVSDKALDRGRVQIGSLGSGNHFLEIQVVDKVFDEYAAQIMGLEEGSITVMIHTGSRGFGHQVASDFLRIMEREVDLSSLPDRELVSVEFNSELGQQYYLSMNAAANFAFTNRQLITHWVRQSFENVFGVDSKSLDLGIVYDVTHNMAKVETHVVDGVKRKLVIHRKGATRSLGKGNSLLPLPYKRIGQPVLIPGSMGTASYVLLGSNKAEEVSFSSTAHGAGRVMSRKKAIKSFTKNQVEKLLRDKGIYVRSDSWRGVVEEAPQVYKDIDDVAKVSHEVGIGTLVARLVPVGVVKG